MKMGFVASIIGGKLCIIFAFFDFFAQKTFSTKLSSLIAEINFTIWGQLYTCLVLIYKLLLLFRGSCIVQNIKF